jgi:hypothetical protein
LLFDEFLIVANNKNNGMKSMKDYFKWQWLLQLTLAGEMYEFAIMVK